MSILEKTITLKPVICYHCGEVCEDNNITENERHFCCIGCKTVYEILEENNLCRYYEFEDTPGITQKRISKEHRARFSFLDDNDVKQSLINFTNGNTCSIIFRIPQIHCSSCIWLLENLNKLNSNITISKVNFLQKNVRITFDSSGITLRQLVELLVSIGYEPELNLDDLDKTNRFHSNKKLYYKIGIAGFCFGNIMLLSFPEYLSFGSGFDNLLKQYFGLLNILLALPVFFYCASGYFKSAYTALKQKTINIDFPISLGLAVLFSRSLYEILTQTGAGFFDSMTGLIFFLLLGKLFQAKTYDTLNFDRDYKSYFPVSVTIKKDKEEIIIPVSKLKQGDRIIVRNGELIPADAILFSTNADIDYSFVTGEAMPVGKVAGEIIYAGGKQFGEAIELEVIRTVSQSYLTGLWNNDIFKKKDDDRFNSLVNIIGKYFTILILLIAAAAFVYWYKDNLRTAINAFTAVLIIACPCGIALTNPFALGNVMRIFGKNRFYIKNASVVERLSNINHIVFDKTGTITQNHKAIVNFTGSELSNYEQRLVKSLVRNSFHPLSLVIYETIQTTELFKVCNFKESVSKGIEGAVDGHIVRVGSAVYIADGNNLLNYWNIPENKLSTKIFLSIDNHIKGFFSVSNSYREGIGKLIGSFNDKYKISILTGDNSGEQENLKLIFGNKTNLLFNQQPIDKLKYINRIQSNNENVLMIGDGLNDAGALKQSNVGIAVTENINNFSPQCDAILDASKFQYLNKLLNFSGTTKKIMIASYAISIVYNIIGVTLAFQSTVSPLLAAILMPVSSVSVVLFTVLSTNVFAKKRGLL